ncbi:hypothetical protein HPP92_001057 [Vanilla planifolia]|uniref:Uncharacterized protein n=1 Tax=Vanilla planifolia TaxID=51239 RepID=A0A835S5Z2_VANPL|nr:hypothetical protein HPP92_001169 [Vanilla planifolia]KAG0500985.1 hypothetical protein HPP92_001057 [Vanilla planifolia]
MTKHLVVPIFPQHLSRKSRLHVQDPAMISPNMNPSIVWQITINTTWWNNTAAFYNVSTCLAIETLSHLQDQLRMSASYGTMVGVGYSILTAQSQQSIYGPL